MCWSALVLIGDSQLKRKKANSQEPESFSVVEDHIKLVGYQNAKGKHHVPRPSKSKEP